jgi:hypothetical protein
MAGVAATFLGRLLDRLVDFSPVGNRSVFVRLVVGEGRLEWELRGCRRGGGCFRSSLGGHQLRHRKGDGASHCLKGLHCFLNRLNSRRHGA